jgi:DNA-directed RNA polymerase specialized sigma24 family protein
VRRPEELVPLEALSGRAAGPAWATEAADDAELACLATLPAPYAEIVLLRIVGDFDSNEVATIVGKKPGTVRVMQKRALERLAELLVESSTLVVTR